MGKQAKKKQKSDVVGQSQKTHNRATRGVNTSRRLCVWGYEERVTGKDAEGNALTKKVKITYPQNTMWDWTRIYDAVPGNDGVLRLMRRKSEKQKPLQAPFDRLLDDTLDDDIRGYAEDHSAGVERTSIGDGRFQSEVFMEEFCLLTNKKKKRIMLTVVSSSNAHFQKPKNNKKFSRKKR
tara:strand:- start:881 stop:1420 length:540 start_codon:yes stop_codon:yes gene_type:complete